MANLKILVAYHKKSPVVENEVFLPIHLGQGDDYDYLATQMIGDDTGDNISQKNSTYNEFTAVYWAWKNYDKIGNPDYIGLNHYRRFFIFEKRKYAFYDWKAGSSFISCNFRYSSFEQGKRCILFLQKISAAVDCHY